MAAKLETIAATTSLQARKSYEVEEVEGDRILPL
jgi:hypothetical protein